MEITYILVRAQPVSELRRVVLESTFSTVVLQKEEIILHINMK